MSLILLIIGVRTFLKGLHRSKSEKVLSHIDPSTHSLRQVGHKSDFISVELRRLGADLSPKKLSFFLITIILIAFIAAFFFGALAAVLVVLIAPLVFYLVMKLRYERRVSRMVEQLPMFLDHSVRSLMSGRTLGDAMLLAMDSVPAPLGEAFKSTRRQIDHGVAMQDAITDFAEFYQRDEFRILALGLRVNSRYGGNSSDLLKSLIVLVRDRDRMARTLKAMTGETRLSAVVLASMPAGLASYLMLTNPSFFLGLWEDSLGKMLLFVAFGLQVLGSFIMWKMLRSVK
ncbi:type II secretion system F family protein [Denitrificimonas sp. JX-1]|uniref:Type II secretion system F family protein n=1 Tax=Denitrificimonas halotolerans TaxID=3098930 RepID=A0ABU5GRP9_9GAMM|nr:type II secretion system F family protein [Denitrificimonas sp. JX-1]MDY7219524.1 type II secretion system F family protein [Denitrificimonas sp. JX-1]